MVAASDVPRSPVPGTDTSWCLWDVPVYLVPSVSGLCPAQGDEDSWGRTRLLVYRCLLGSASLGLNSPPLCPAQPSVTP